MVFDRKCFVFIFSLNFGGDDSFPWLLQSRHCDMTFRPKKNKNNDISAVTHFKKFGTLHNMVEYWIIEWV